MKEKLKEDLLRALLRAESTAGLKALPQPVFPINNLPAENPTEGNLNGINWFIQTITDESRQSPATALMGAASGLGCSSVLQDPLSSPGFPERLPELESSTLTTKCYHKDLYTAPAPQ